MIGCVWSTTAPAMQCTKEGCQAALSISAVPFSRTCRNIKPNRALQRRSILFYTGPSSNRCDTGFTLLSLSRVLQAEADQVQLLFLTSLIECIRRSGLQSERAALLPHVHQVRIDFSIQFGIYLPAIAQLFRHDFLGSGIQRMNNRKFF